MLILSRKSGERIMIGDDIVIEIVRVKDTGNVQIGIHAPRGVPVDREEVYESKKKERGE